MFRSGSIALLAAAAVGVFSAMLDIGFLSDAGLELSMRGRAIVVLGGGLLYALAGIFWFKALFNDGLVSRILYVVFQSSIIFLMMFVSPAAGIIDVLILPIVSQSMFMFNRRISIVISVLLIGLVGLVDILSGFYLPGLISRVSGSTAFVLFVWLFSQRLLQEQQLRLEVANLNQRLRELAEQTAELSAANERVRISREIHDSLGHHLTTVAVQLEVAQQLIQKDPERAEDLVGKARALTRQGLQDVREAVAQWRTSAEALKSLDEAVFDMVAIANETGLNVHLTTSGSFDGLPSPAQRALYRVAQEGLTNIRKHARDADQIMVALEGGEVTRLRVRDNGRGTVSPSASGGYGLTGLNERIQMLGGKLHAAPHPEGGFELLVEVPNG